MANELIAQSSSRQGATVLWITIHTAEGPTDAYPTDPNRGSGSAQSLLTFFTGKTDRSCHAIADDDVLLDNLVPYDRAAWTLRNGNPRSDNLEMCGLASWSRDEWLTHKGMLELAAKWVASRLKARGLPDRRLTIAQVADRSMAGYMDHNTYTQASGDGTHWDVGPNFPWDYFGGRVTANLTGIPQEDDMQADEVRQILGLKPGQNMALAIYGQGDNSQVLRRITATNDANSVAARMGRLEAAVADLAAAVAALTPAPPTPTQPPASGSAGSEPAASDTEA